MKTNYFYAVVFGIMSLISHSQNILFDGDFSLTTEIVPFDTLTPPLNAWAYSVNEESGAEVNPLVVDGVAKMEMQNAGYDYPDVQLTQVGFPLNQGHVYQLTFDVRADSDRYVRLFLGEEGGNAINLIESIYFYLSTGWQTISLQFEATSVFDLHKLSFEFGGNDTTTYLDNVVLQDLGPAPPEKVVISGTFQNAMGCETDWDPVCEITALTFNSSTELYSGTFEIPEGNHRYKVAVGGSWDINYGENGAYNGADIFLCIPAGPEEITFTYDPVTHLVTTSPMTSGFSPDCLPIVVLSGSFQDELGCSSDGMYDCLNTALTFNSESGLFEGDFYIPSGCYDYRVVLDNNWQNNYGQEGIFNGEDYSLYIPSNPEVTHFTYDPINHVVTSSPYSRPPQEATAVSIEGSSFQNELTLNAASGLWEGSFTLSEGCYTYQVREIIGCNENYYGENGEYYGSSIELYVPAEAEITFKYDPQTHLVNSTPYSGYPEEITSVSLEGSLQNELILNADSGLWEGSFSLSEGCYTYQVQEKSACITASYGENGETGGYIQLYVPLDGEVSFSYDLQTHIISSSPYSGTPQEVTAVSLAGSSLQNELILNSDSGLWEGSFTLPEGCYSYQVREIFGCDTESWGEEIQLYIPENQEIHFIYDPETHIIESTPYSGVPQEVTNVSLVGSFQDELGCEYEFDYYGCDKPALENNLDTGMWEGSFWLPAGCYTYFIKETFGCNIIFYGENGTEGNIDEIQLYLPEDGEISFTYDPETHLINSTPFSSPEISKVSLTGTIQEVLCAPDYYCDKPALIFNAETGSWVGNFTLPKGCYTYQVREISTCNEVFYGENGEMGSYIQLYVPEEAEITFSYDQRTHLISSTPYSGVPQEVTKVSLVGSLQDELGCAYDGDYGCDNPALLFDSESGAWKGSFTLPAGCYTYRVKETFGCNVTFYGENGIEWGNEIQLYVPSDGEITFTYDPQTHVVTSTPYYPVPEEVTAVSLLGDFQMELGCEYNEDPGCDKPALMFNPDSGFWEGSFVLPAGCYSYRVKETFGCEVNYYGKNGEYWTPIELFVPEDGVITFSYDPQSHSISSTPYSGVTIVSLLGSFQDEFGCESEANPNCDKPALVFNPDSGFWEGSFTLPAGCYWYLIKEKFGCNEWILFGENGQESGDVIHLYVPSDGEITFSYDPQTHLISSTPYGDVPPDMTKVSLSGTLQDELGCADAWEDNCENSALEFNPSSGMWEGSFTLPAGCYDYRVREATVCAASEYGENGNPWGEIQLYVPAAGEITFSYDPKTHIVTSTPYYSIPEEVTAVSLVGSLQNELGCDSDEDTECDKPALGLNTVTGLWEGSFTLPAGCYTYQVKETFGCDWTLYGENGSYWGDRIQLYIPEDQEISFTYDPETNIVTTTPYSGIPQEATAVSLTGFPDEMGCPSAGDNGCNEPALQFNSDTGLWEAQFSLPAGCYFYKVKETSTCKETSYGENGYPGSYIQLYIPTENAISFSYDPQTHLMTTSPFSGVPEEVTSVTLNGYFGDTVSYPTLTKNEVSGNWESNFELPAGCYTFWVEETVACWYSYRYGENGEAEVYGGKVIQLYIPESGEVSFSYDPQTHIMTSSPYTGAPQETTEVSISIYPNDLPLIFNPDTGEWEGSIELASDCYYYEVRETFGCEEISYGGNQFYVPLGGEITFRYDPQTHNVISTPYSGVPEEVTNVNLNGYLDGEYGSIPLSKNEVTGNWEGTYMAPIGCYAYLIEEIIGCTNGAYYGENGQANGPEIQLNIPSAREITFTYDPETHLITSTPYSGAPEGVTKVSLYGSIQDKLGCDDKYDYECNSPALTFNSSSKKWEGSFTLPVGCYSYLVKETIGCNIETVYGEKGVEWGKEIELYVPTEGEITFSYDPQTNMITSSPYGGIPEDVTSVSLFGSLQNEMGCSSDYDAGCDGPALSFNDESNMWEGSFTLPAGCYTYRVKETFGCETKTYYGKDGTKSGDDIWLFVPVESEITFSYNPQTHIITSTPYSDNSTIVVCPSDIFVVNSPELCGAMVNYPEMVANFDCGGDVSSVTQTAGLPSGSDFPIGTTTNTFELVRTTGEVTTCSFDVVVTDSEAPTIVDLKENYEHLWPPNHKMVPVYIEYIAIDNCNIAGTEIYVTSNEPESGQGNGDKSPDWEIIDAHHVLLRAERSGKGDGREYYITIKVTDSSGNFTEEVVTVTVLNNQGKMAEAVSESEVDIKKYTLYPNPAKEKIRIKGPQSCANRPYGIYDMLGVLKKQGIIDGDEVEVEFLPSGAYTLKFETDEGYVIKQFIKK